MTKAALAAITCLALAGNAQAQGLFSFDPAEGGAFVSGFAGSSSPGDADLSGAGTRLDAAFDSAAAYGAAAGYRLPFRYWTYFQPRLELEISSTESDVSSARLNGMPRTATGELTRTSFLFNNYNDITWSDGQKIVPFLGGGLGFSQLDLTLSDASAPAFTINDDTTAFTTTFAGGVTWHATERFELYGEARYTTVYGAAFERLATGAPGQSLEDDLTAAAFTLGARIGF